MPKLFLSSLALLTTLLTMSLPGTAQSQPPGKTKSDANKVKTRQGGAVSKAKVAPEGKTKVKAKSPAGSKLKAKAKPAAANKIAPGVLVGGNLMMPDQDIVENAVNSTEHTTLVSALRAGGLVETLKGPGPLTVFAPTNAAFDKLPAGTVNTLVMPENKQRLATMLAYHVVSGRLLANDLKDGQQLTTLEGETLTVVRKGTAVLLRDVRGGTATVTIADVLSRNGVTHVIDTVLLPNK
ncbi:fasciclin domain-containing protein [Hymenobacter chitinivorans]|uniref:Putative surface protein with fasciclin (FAS1) repeats n=1 Tax=Hymenobacter chitinivorans DSM 11115 TaxID=1121954 RepID=A0A2M9BN58_9BACT|nr:fasciclin domain-containing protein [Hymenobacter chitinivorans]PJJ59391.1 putative surface protein with fasciclin (FAS1) repeats [Hymenobacter chitinivorans DSM 11115]